jgi:hypothetical protein
MDVNVFNVSIQDKVRRISGCYKKRGHVPPDLALIVAQSYHDTQIQEFDLEVISIVRALDMDLDCYTPVQILSMLGDQYDSLVNTDRWPHKSKHKELAEEVGQLKALQRKQGRYEKGQHNRNNNIHNGSNDHANRTHAAPKIAGLPSGVFRLTLSLSLLSA